MRCAGCGKTVQTAFGEGRFAAQMKRIAASSGVLCDDCIAAQEVADEAARLAAEAAKLRSRSGIPPALRGLELETVERDADRTDAFVQIRRWAAGASHAQGIYLYGEVGVGKTWLTAAACEAQLSRGVPVRWVSVAELLTALGLPFGDPGYAEAVRSLGKAPGVLVLDDLDKAQANDRNAQPLFSAIDAQISAGRPLAVTANRDLEGMASRLSPSFGDAIASRLAGYCLVAQVGGRDRRLDDD